MNKDIYSIDEIKTVLSPVFDKYKVKKAVLFGSYAKGIAKEHSDIDLLVDSGLRGLAFVGLMEEIRCNVDKEIDVFDVTHITPHSRISSEISKDGVVIYGE